MKNLLQSKRVRGVGAALLLATLLYAVGIQFLFVPVLVGSLALTLPFPRIFSSLLSRLFISAMLMYGILQVAIVTQFFVLPQSNFLVLALLGAVYAALSIWLGLRSSNSPRRFTVLIDRKDIIALAVAAIFMVPFGWYCFGSNGLTHITGMAAVQVPDATNHFFSLTDMYQKQHIPRQLDYYPKGFDLSTAFIQNSFGLNQTTMTWTANARLFMGQYVLFNSVLAYSLTYLAYMFLERFSNQERAARSGFLLILGLGLPLTALYLLPFIFEGFLNFSYVGATIACAFIYLAALSEVEVPRIRRWYMVGYLLLILGVSMSWPLMTPPLLLVPILYFWPQEFNLHALRHWIFRRENVPIGIAFGVQLLPLYMDYRYSTPGTNSLNTPGALSVFHWGILAAGIAMTCYLLVSKTIAESHKRIIKSIFIPFIVLMAGLVTYQYFTVGQPIYYSIKSDYILELLALVLLVAWITSLFARTSLSKLEKVGIVALVPLLIYMFLIGMSGNNPLDDMRKLLREHSNFGKPTFFDADVHSITELGRAGKIQDSNVTILHYEASDGKLFANMQPAYWANAVHYKDDPANSACRIGDLYGTTTYLPYSPEQQAAIMNETQACIKLAQRNHEFYYIVTDGASVPYLQQLFGNGVVLVR